MNEKQKQEKDATIFIIISLAVNAGLNFDQIDCVVDNARKDYDETKKRMYVEINARKLIAKYTAVNLIARMDISFPVQAL